jgi:anthranilate/para-aminobenzoate synthase component I
MPPTPVPSYSPTPEPSDFPTHDPTFEPTTATPTKVPTVAPSPKPTKLPSQSPTAEPTEIQSLHDEASYLSNIQDCLDLIIEGESYELCLTNQLSSKYDPSQGTILDFYSRDTYVALRKAN